MDELDFKDTLLSLNISILSSTILNKTSVGQVCVNQQSNIGRNISLSAIGSFKVTIYVQVGLL